MGKKHKAKKADKAAAFNGTAELSKKERKKLEAREAELSAALAAKAKLKGKKKAKTEKPTPPPAYTGESKGVARAVDRGLLTVTEANSLSEKKAKRLADERKADTKTAKADPPAALPKLADLKPATLVKATESKAPPTVEESDNAERIATLTAIIDDIENNSQKTRDMARRNLAKLTGSEAAPAEVAATDETDEQIAARVKSKRLAREQLLATAETVDRDDQDAVDAYNARMAELGGGSFITGTAERERAASSNAEALATAIKKRKPGKDELTVTIDGETLAEPLPAQVVEQVETEQGREFVAGTADEPEGFGKPSEAPTIVTLEEGRNGYKIHPLKPDGTPDLKKELQFTRVTTFIDCLESKKTLEDWSRRVLLEGVALSDTSPAEERPENLPESIVATVRDLIHRRDVALSKAHKADRKGKLTPGQLDGLLYDANKQFKDAVDTLADAAMEFGGIHEKADKGTDLHELVQSFDASGLSVDEFAAAQDETIAPSSLDSLRAYDAAMRAIGAKVVASEVVVVDDVDRTAGRLDSVIMVKLPGTQRATRVVGDIKSGRVDYGVPKIAQQLGKYANSKGYDLVTGERTDLKLSKSVGLLIHLPQGKGTCTIHLVDLTIGAKGNALAKQVRAWRNDGKKAIDLTRDLVAEASA